MSSYTSPVAACVTPGWNDPPVITGSFSNPSTRAANSRLTRHKRPVDPSIQSGGDLYGSIPATSHYQQQQPQHHQQHQAQPQFGAAQFPQQHSAAQHFASAATATYSVPQQHPHPLPHPASTPQFPVAAAPQLTPSPSQPSIVSAASTGSLAYSPQPQRGHPLTTHPASAFTPTNAGAAAGATSQGIHFVAAPVVQHPTPLQQHQQQGVPVVPQQQPMKSVYDVFTVQPGKEL
ncbi:hypothetical protein AAVH_09891 [Aphelenchoides avenae]|nr:hypothetical protein AAVH_09891 [Aphelenchus avenae]